MSIERRILCLFFILMGFCLFSENILFENSEENNDIAYLESVTDVEEQILRGIILLKDPREMNPPYWKEKIGVTFYKIDIPGDPEKLRKKLNNFIGLPLTSNDLLDQIKSSITSYYQSVRYPFVAVIIPEQEIENGILQVIVVQAKLGKVVVKGNKWFKKERIEEHIRLRPNEPIELNQLEQDIYWINRNPFRQGYVIYTPGEEKGTTDVEVVVKDNLPFRPYFGTDNIGTDVTGNTRLFTGFMAGNLFDGHQLSYQFTTDNRAKRFMAHSLIYKIPLPWRHQLVLLGGYSHVNAYYIDPQKYQCYSEHINGVSSQTKHYHTKGFSLQTSLRYDIPLPPRKGFLHEFSWGFDFKRTNNNLEWNEIPVYPAEGGRFANITQGMVGYNLGYVYKKFTCSFEIESFFSPGQWVSDQKDSQYQTLRYRAKNSYMYCRGTSSFLFGLAQEGSWRHYLRWQVASANLLPSEEYGLGGYDTVRGYKEREVNVDHAILYTTELRLPPLRIMKTFTKNKLDDRFEVLGFFDLGWGEKKHEVPNVEKKRYTLMSVGPGIRYTIAPYLTLRADWGFQLRYLGCYGLGGHNKIHFSVILGL